MEDILCHDAIKELKKEYENGEFIDYREQKITFYSFKDFVFDYDYGMGYVFYSIHIKYNTACWGCGFFENENNDICEDNGGWHIFKHKILSEEHFRFYEIPEEKNNDSDYDEEDFDNFDESKLLIEVDGETFRNHRKLYKLLHPDKEN